MLDELAVGRIVHYVLSADDGVEESAVGSHRAAIVVEDWPQLGRDDGYSNLLVFLDGSNDRERRIGVSVADESPIGSVKAPPLLWATSRVFSASAEPGTWHWPERAAAKPEAPPHARTAAPGSAFPVRE